MLDFIYDLVGRQKSPNHTDYTMHSLCLPKCNRFGIQLDTGYGPKFAEDLEYLRIPPDTAEVG
jgi:hypothetical protein